MLTKFLKKEGAFNYTRLFFILMGGVLIVAIGFGGYTFSRYNVAEKNKQDSEAFFSQYKPSILKYKEKRSFYQKNYGDSKTVVNDKKNSQIIDTYHSADGSKGITITYQIPNGQTDEAYVIGYFLFGSVENYTEAQLLKLENAKNTPLAEIQEQVGAGEVMSELKTDNTFEIRYRLKGNLYILNGDRNTTIIKDVRVEKTQ